MGIIRSKHQKLILQCYPPGKGVEKKPNPLELSYLLYYASTRRVKLEKVIEFLKLKTAKDVRSRKSGNLQVTLLLVSALIEKCADNLNVFAMQVCDILLQILTLQELPLCKTLVATYGILCNKLDDGLFSGDKLFVALFSSLTQQMISDGQMQLSIDTTNSREWHIFALLTSRHVFNCLGFNSALSLKFVSLCVPLLARAVSNTYTKEMLVSRLQGNLNVEQETMRPLMRTVTSKSVVTNRRIEPIDEDESLNDDDLGDEAFSGLKTLFNTLSASQISEGIKAIEVFCYNEKTIDTHWGTTFLQTCASFIPVQMRFVALTTLLNKLTNLSDNTTSDSNLFVELEHVARYVLALVSSDFNMIGLSTSDVISQLLVLQKKLYLNLSGVFEPAQITRLSSICSRCISNLSSHIYYFDQVRDSVEEIIAHIDSILTNANTENATSSRLLVMRLLDTIYVILERLSEKSNAIARHRGTLENLDLSLQLLTISTAYPKFAKVVTNEDIIALQTKYLEVVLYFLKREVVMNNEQSAELQAESIVAENKLLAPNYNNYIEHSENIVRRMIHHSKEFFQEASFTIENGEYVAKMLQTTLELCGINFVYNFIMYFDHWQLKEPTSSLSACYRDTTAYLLLESSLTILDQHYGDALLSSITELSLQKSIMNDISQRKSIGLWVDGKFTHNASVPAEKLKNYVSQNSLIEFFASTELSQWLHGMNASFVSGNLQNGIANGHDPDNHQSEFNTTDEFVSNYHLVAPQSSESGLGLGSANDITSIYSGILNGHAKSNGNITPDTSHITQASIPTFESAQANPAASRHVLVPRVQDLKHTVNGEEGDDNFMFHDSGTNSVHRSVIQRQIQTTNMSSLLNGLYSEEDSKLVV